MAKVHLSAEEREILEHNLAELYGVRPAGRFGDRLEKKLKGFDKEKVRVAFRDDEGVRASVAADVLRYIGDEGIQRIVNEEDIAVPITEIVRIYASVYDGHIRKLHPELPIIPDKMLQAIITETGIQAVAEAADKIAKPHHREGVLDEKLLEAGVGGKKGHDYIH